MPLMRHCWLCIRVVHCGCDMPLMRHCWLCIRVVHCSCDYAFNETLLVVYVCDSAGSVVPLNSYWSETDGCCVQSVYCRPCRDNEQTTTWLGVQVKALMTNCCPRLQPNQASLQLPLWFCCHALM